MSLCKRHSRNETQRKCVFREFKIKLVPTAVQYLNLRFMWKLKSVKLRIAMIELEAVSILLRTVSANWFSNRRFMV